MALPWWISGSRSGIAGGHARQESRPMSNPYNESPFNALPPVVVALALPIVAVAGAVGWRLDALRDYAFFGPVLEAMIETRRWPLTEVARFVTYPFVHYGFTHMLMVIVFLLALGKMVGEIFSPVAVLIIFFASAIVGALAFTFLTADATPLAGGYPAVYGLIGAYTFILWVRLGAQGASQMRAFSLIGLLLGVQLIFGLLFGSGQQWVAEVAGFCTGFALSFVVSPGGWQRARARMRAR
jgi:membrane associated rhomboid family serine protease